MGNRRRKKSKQQAEVCGAEMWLACQVRVFVCSGKLRFWR